MSRSDRPSGPPSSGPVALEARGKDSDSGLLGPSTIGLLRHEGSEIGFAEGQVIVRRGERHRFFYVVVDGEVELCLLEGTASRRSFARLGVGATFGAESVVVREGAAMDVVAATDVRLLQYPASRLEAALRDSASLRSKLLGGIARELHDATEDVLSLLKGTQIIIQLVQGEDESRELVTESARMRAVRNRISSCARTAAPVLIVGPPGTGKTLAARIIHQQSARRRGPLIAVNCRRLPPENATELILGTPPEEGSSSPLTGGGGVHLASGGTLVLRDLDTLPRVAQEALATSLRAPAGNERASSDTRIVATVSSTDPDSRGSGGLIPELVEAFAEPIVKPALAQRRRDILPLAEDFLARQGPDPPRLAESARHALLSMDYRRNNVSELREVVELACRVADGDEIRAEHILGDAGEDALPTGVDLATGLKAPLWTRPGFLRVVRAVVAGAFGGVIALCVVAAGSSVGRAANATIWTLWEPIVFGLFLLIGPAWCTVCPISTAGRLAARLFSLERPPPGWVLRVGPWVALSGFVLIVWSERAFDMTRNPLPSAVMLSVLVAAAVLLALVYRREVWCRHLCPLGRLAVSLAPASPLQLTARRSVCASVCKNHECFKGDGSIPGCTVFHHPLEAKTAHHCKLCLDCLHSCPHGSSRLQLRPPLAGIWRLDAGAAGVATFGYAVSVLALALLVPRRVPALADPMALALMCVLAVGLGFVLHRSVRWLFRGGVDLDVPATRIGFALMVLGWSDLMAAQLGNIPLVAGATLRFPAAPWWREWIPSTVGVLPVLQSSLIAAAFAAAVVVLWGVCQRHPGSSRSAWLITLGLFGAYAACSLALVL